MKSTPHESLQFAEKVSEVELRLQRLGQAIAEVGQPAAQELKRRFDVLFIENNALKRNFEESLKRGEPDVTRMKKLETLLLHIEREESSVEHEVSFLNQAAPSSMVMAVEAGAHLVDLYRRGIKRVIGEHHPLGSSVFVNHSHENLKSDYGLAQPEISSSPSDSKSS